MTPYSPSVWGTIFRLSRLDVDIPDEFLEDVCYNTLRPRLRVVDFTETELEQVTV